MNVVRPKHTPSSLTLCARAGVLLLFASGGAAACGSKKQTPVSVAAEDASTPMRDPTRCATDDDCAPLNCCYPVTADTCILKKHSNCAKAEVTCEPPVGPRLVCACVANTCMGVPGGAPDGGKATVSFAALEPTSSAPAPQPTSRWATGGLDDAAVLQVVMAHGADVKACRALAKNAQGSVTLEWDVAPAGNVTKSSVGFASASSASLKTCLAAKAKTWRFPARKTSSHVQYTFQFGG